MSLYCNYYGEVRLGHSFILIILDYEIGHTILDNGPHSSPWDVLSLGTFFTWEVLYLGRFFPRMFCPLGRFVLGRFVLGRFVLGRFVCASVRSKGHILTA